MNMSVKSIILFISIVVLAVSCRTTKIVEKEVPVTETKIEYRDKVVEKEVFVHDSVNVYINGDTVREYRDRTYTKFVHDTLKVFITDSVEVPVRITNTEIKEVNHLYWWQKVLMLVGAVYIGVLIYKLIKLF